MLASARQMLFHTRMAGWAKRKNTNEQIDAAGRALIDHRTSPSDLDRALIVVNNWRACHAFPLNTFQNGLRHKARQVDQKALVAQRIKRLPAIHHKLTRMRRLSLSEMQDIGGCRAVVGSVRSVRRLVDLYANSHILHQLAHEDDYIATPRDTGYRSYHLIYSYRSDRSEAYNGQNIEMQFRSRLQHAWATAVETVGTFRQQSLKSNWGDKQWLRFFALMGTAIAMRESCPPVDGTPTKRGDLVSELRDCVRTLNVEGHLKTYREALRIVKHPALRGARYFLLRLDPTSMTMEVTGYRAGELEQASRDYLSAERRDFQQPGLDAVLVSVESMNALHRAYPNYFLDTRLFLDAVKAAVALR